MASLYLIQTPKQWSLKENTEGQLESERQWGIPTDARAEGTVPWVSLLCDLGPTLFIFSVTLRSLCGCSLSVGLRCFASRVGFCCVSCSAGDHSVHCCYSASWLHAVSFRLAAVSFSGLPSFLRDRWGCSSFRHLIPFISSAFQLPHPPGPGKPCSPVVTLGTQFCPLSSSA